MVAKFKILALLTGVTVAGLASLTFLPTGADSAQGAASDVSAQGAASDVSAQGAVSDVLDGPVVYLNHEGTANGCEIAVTATTENGQAYSKAFSRPNCDGGMMLPTLRLDSKLTVEANSEESDAGGDLIVSDELDVSKLSAGGPGYVTNSTAICFLVRKDGSMNFTKASDQPNPRPCAWP